MPAERVGYKRFSLSRDDERAFLIAELRVVELGEHAAAAHQLGDDAVAQHQDQVASAYRRQAVRDDEGRAAAW
jgi:hypothetical protein